MGQLQTIEDLINFISRRLWLILSVTVCGMLIAAWAAKTSPDVYEAAAAIQVQDARIAAGQSLGHSLGQSNAQTGGAAQVLQTIEQRLTTREAVLAMIARHQLYTDLPLTDDEKVNLLRQSIGFHGIEAAGQQSYGQAMQISAIVVSAKADQPEKAARIANDFAQGILDMSSLGQIERARDTFAFYEEEVIRVTAEINALETALSAYKNKHAAALPALTEARRSELSTLDIDTRAIEQELVALSGEERQLRARNDLRATETRRLGELEKQTAILNAQKAALAQRRDSIAREIASEPQIELEIASMGRELTRLQTQLNVVTSRLTEAETAQRLAERQQGERFALLDRAVTPQMPIGSGGKKLFIMGSVFSVVFGVILAFLLDLIRPVVRSAAQMERQLGLQPVMIIPELSADELGWKLRVKSQNTPPAADRGRL